MSARQKQGTEQASASLHMSVILLCVKNTIVWVVLSVDCQSAVKASENIFWLVA